jgi:SAM-dependent methyltransferase
VRGEEAVTALADEVASDGSPVAVYLAAPAVPSFRPVLDVVAAGASVLDLGCGVGRLANLLAARGHHVTGVDESAAMLRHVDPRVRMVEARIEELDLRGRYDVVVLASHLVNVVDDVERGALLGAAARHVAPTGCVLVEHHDAAAMRDIDVVEGEFGPVHVTFRVLARRGEEFDGEVLYRLGERTWLQRFTATLLDGARLDAAFRQVGLRRAERLSPTWTLARLVAP